MSQENNFFPVVPKNQCTISNQDRILSRIYLNNNLQRIKWILFIVIIIKTIITILFFFLNWTQMSQFDWSLLGIDLMLNVSNIAFSIYILYQIKKINTQINCDI